MPWFIVSGYIEFPHQGPFLDLFNGKVQSFCSIPTKALTSKDAIEYIFAGLQEEYDQATSPLKGIPERDIEAIDTALDAMSEDETTRLFLASKPVRKEEWTAENISAESAQGRLREIYSERQNEEQMKCEDLAAEPL